MGYRISGGLFLMPFEFDLHGAALRSYFEVRLSFSHPFSKPCLKLAELELGCTKACVGYVICRVVLLCGLASGIAYGLVRVRIYDSLQPETNSDILIGIP